MRILREELDFKELIAKVLSVDYLGSLAGSLLFALVLVPQLGLTRTSILVGMLNCVVALMSTWVLADLLRPRSRLRLRIKGALLAGLLIAGFVAADRLTELGEQAFYADPIVYARRTPYQRIVLTRGRGSIQLFLNGNLQFSSSDEYRYHESLVHPAFSATDEHDRVLVLGGGDGLAVREILRYADVKEITLVDLDAGVTEMATTVPAVRELNGGSLLDPRVTLIHDDAMVWLDETDSPPFDIVIVDFPDPNNFSLGKLYTRRFYRLVQKVMHDDTALIVQSTSPMYARRSYWCIERTMHEAGLQTAPFHVSVPSFGEWGYVLAKRTPFSPPRELHVDALRFLTPETLRSLFLFPVDMAPVDVATNLLNNQRLVHYYEAEWARWQ
jgi:spermidine synthase